MYPESIDGGLELRKAVEPRLSPAPVVFLEPIRTDVLCVPERQPLRPIIDTLPLRPSRGAQAAFQIVEFGVCRRDSEGGDFVAHRPLSLRDDLSRSRISRATIYQCQVDGLSGQLGDQPRLSLLASCRRINRSFRTTKAETKRGR